MGVSLASRSLTGGVSQLPRAAGWRLPGFRAGLAPAGCARSGPTSAARGAAPSHASRRAPAQGFERGKVVFFAQPLQEGVPQVASLQLPEVLRGRKPGGLRRAGEPREDLPGVAFVGWRDGGGLGFGGLLRRGRVLPGLLGALLQMLDDLAEPRVLLRVTAHLHRCATGGLSGGGTACRRARRGRRSSAGGSSGGGPGGGGHHGLQQRTAGWRKRSMPSLRKCTRHESRSPHRRGCWP